MVIFSSIEKKNGFRLEKMHEKDDITRELLQMNSTQCQWKGDSPSPAVKCNTQNILFLLEQHFPSIRDTIHHHQLVVPPARISLTLSRHFSLLFIASGRSSELHPVSSHSCCMYDQAGRLAFAWPYVGIHWSTSLMSSSLLLQQCPACLVSLTWIVFVMAGRWPYIWCFVGCCRQDLFNIAAFLCNCRLASSPVVLLASK